MKTYKALGLVVFFLAFSVPAFSQFTFGPKVGINFSNLHQISEFGTGVDAGFFFRMGKRLHFQPELTYSSQNSTVIIQYDGDYEPSTIFKVEMHYFDIPLLLGYKIVNRPNFKLRTFIGPRVGILLNYNDNTFTKYTAQVGGLAGLGIDVWRFTLDFKYDFSVVMYKKQMRESKSPKCNIFNLNVGFKIFKD